MAWKKKEKKDSVLAEQKMVRFKTGTFERIENVLEEGESQSEFIRRAVNAEIFRRTMANAAKEKGKTEHSS